MSKEQPRERYRPLTVEGVLRRDGLDPERKLAKAAADAERRRHREGLIHAHEPLIRELNEAGYPVGAVWELMETGLPYPEAVPVLLRHLSRQYPDQVRERVARALATPEASGAWALLVDEFVGEPAGTGAKDGLAVALSAHLTEDRLAEFLQLVQDPGHGDSRLLLLEGLQRLSRRKRSAARTAYAALADDPVLGAEVRRVLKRRRSP
jgi:hypothetical protein